MKEENTKERKRKNKVKRQISIFTVILWIFLIGTMLTITINSTKKTNALEVTDNNWNISLIMYDRSGSAPNEAITDFTWNATNNSERKQLCMQINYSCTTGKEYAPGEIEISINGFGKNGSELNKNYYPDVVIAADQISDTDKKYDFSYEYDENKNIYTFVNNKLLKEDEHFEGTIQLVYNIFPRFKVKTDLEFKAKIKEKVEDVSELIIMESNVCNFHYNSNKKAYSLNNLASVLENSKYLMIKNKLGDIVDDHYWVDYKFTQDCGKEIIYAYDTENIVINNRYYETACISIKENFPKDCIVYDSYFNKLDPVEDNIYYYLKTNSHYYVGYPKNKYNEGDKITNIAELWGRYEDESNLEKLTKANASVNLVDFSFDYNGELYSISKSANTSVSENSIKNGSEILRWNIYFTSFYTDKSMDVEIGDDLLYITRKNGEVTKLNDDEYNFTKMKIPVFYTYNKYSGSHGDILIGYNYEIQVRYKDTSEYVKYNEGVTSDKSQDVTFNSNDIVGIKVVIKDLNKTLYSGNISVYTNINTKDCNIGKIYNFDYLQVYKKDENGNRVLDNETSIDNYTTPSTLKIAEYDINTYKKYMQRGYTSINIKSGYFGLTTDKFISIIKNDVENEKYEGLCKLHCGLQIQNYNVDKDCIIKQYDILPSGMNLLSSKDEILNSIYSSINPKIFILKDGTKFNNDIEINNYIKKNTTIDIDYNYKNSGRTKISIIYNLNDIDWGFCLENDMWLSNFINLDLKVELPYDSILEYGTKYTNYVYSMWNNDEYSYSTNSITDSGRYDPLANDIDEDGDTTEELSYGSSTLNITHAVSSKQSVIKQVRTDQTKGSFVSGTAEATTGSEYTYKLKVTTGANSLKDLIIYDTLETIYDESGNDISSGWKGKFLGVDTTYAVSKGYAPVVYYSEEQNPGKLTEVPDKWKLLTEDTDKSTVKSICVDLRYKADGTEMELSTNNVVFVLINMQAPDDESILTSACNMFSTNWRAKDPVGTVIDNVEGIYSNQVSINIYREENKKQNIKGRKKWADNNDNKRPERIIVKLMQDGIEYIRREVTKTDNWEYEFKDVPVYRNAALEQYQYSIEEESVPYYKTTYDGYNITNTLMVKDIEVTKEWDDYWNKFETRPKSITIKLMQDGIEYIRGEITENDNWEYVFKNVPKYKNENKDEYEYSIEEVEVPGYTYEVKMDGSKYNIVNTLKTKKIEVKKIWDDNDNEHNLRSKVVKVILMDGEEEIDWRYVGDYDNWEKFSFEDLPEFRADGSRIEYKVVEEVEEIFRGEFGYENNFENEGDFELYKNHYVTQIVDGTITNKYVDPNERIKITGTKVWEDNDNIAGKRPDSIVLQIKNGEEIVSEAVVDESTNWSYEFEVPKYDEEKNEIKYHIDEKETSKFYEKELTNETTVINRFVVPDEKVKIPVIKLWEDEENKYNKRPNSITLQVYNGEKLVAESKVDEKNNWRYEFELQKYDEVGNEIEYTVNEKEENKYYEKRISGYTVINKCIYEPTTDTSDINIFVYILVFFIAIIGIIVGIIFVRKNKVNKK